MIRNALLAGTAALLGWAAVAALSGCDRLDAAALEGLLGGAGPETQVGVEPQDEGGTETAEGGQTQTGDGGGTQADEQEGGDVVAGVLRVKALAEALGTAGRSVPSGQAPPDDVDVNLTPTAYTVAFKRLVIKQVDEETGQTLAAVELFSAQTVQDALVVDLLDTAAADVLDVEDLPAGTYNKLDIEVFYLDMTVPTLYPGSATHQIAYRMVFEQMGLLAPRDFLLYLQPEWMEPGSTLAESVTQAGWYWMEMADPDHVAPVAGATAHPDFHVLDLFANEEFWSAEHKVLEGGTINPPLEYDPDEGGVLTISFDVEGTFNFKDYHDEQTPPDGQWEIRRDAGIHPFPPGLECAPRELAAL